MAAFHTSMTVGLIRLFISFYYRAPCYVDPTLSTDFSSRIAQVDIPYQLLISASGYPWKDQDAARTEQEERGSPVGPLLLVHPVRSPLVAGDPSQGGHVQVETQAGLCIRFTGPTVSEGDDHLEPLYFLT